VGVAGLLRPAALGAVRPAGGGLIGEIQDDALRSDIEANRCGDRPLGMLRFPALLCLREFGVGDLVRDHVEK
jgi:hypothetical protein